MVIGIIGAGISGLTAGRLLAGAGHQVTILEKSRGYGGRMATRYAGKSNETKLDHGLSWFTPQSSEFKKFTAELLEKNLIKIWGGQMLFHDGEELSSTNPNINQSQKYIAPDGMNGIGKYLSRWVDVRTESKAGGLTYIGKHRSKKRSWMINMSSSGTFEADAVIIATPAPQAYGIINTTIDEIDTLKIVREIDEINYNPVFSLMLGYGGLEKPEWDGITCKNNPIDFVSNESSKRNDGQECSLVVHASPDFTRKHRNSDQEIIIRELINHLAEIAGGWVTAPEWSQLHFWKYSLPQKQISSSFMEVEGVEAPLALIGDYFNGAGIDAAYRSGLALGQHWIEKFQD